MNRLESPKKQEGLVMPEETYKGIARTLIPWYPTIDYEKCVSCGKCVEYCKLCAYSFEQVDGEKRPVVTKPYNCVVLCKGCQDICPSKAITHPSRKATVDLIRKLLRQKKQ